MTRRPRCTASCVAKPPTAPLAPVTSSVAPAGASISASAWWAVSVFSGTVAPLMSSRPSGRSAGPATDPRPRDHAHDAIADLIAAVARVDLTDDARQIPSGDKRWLQIGHAAPVRSRTGGDVGRVDV